MALLLLYVALYVTMIGAKDTCTILDSLEVLKGKVLLNSTVLNITTDGVLSCSRACLTRSICKSFNYNEHTGNCQLNKETVISPTELESVFTNSVFSDISNWPRRIAGPCTYHTCALNSYCDATDELYTCVIFLCACLPSLENGRFDISPDFSPIGTNILLTCDEEYFPVDNVVCQENGTWSEAQCVALSSCGTVKRFKPDSEDGEYWLILPNMDNYRARIYCHNMTSSTPLEYLTLVNTNHGIYPQKMNYKCEGETELKLSCSGHGGDIWFQKIRVNVETMQVRGSDLTFANVSNVPYYLAYGSAHDCYTRHWYGQLRCGVVGEFEIDLRGTGWRISDEQEWTTYGFLPYMAPIERERNGTLIYLNCGGFPGGCSPRGGLFLTPYPEDMEGP